ncbi:MAG: hypothetical protein Q9190_005099 [Brigantiaea leucoxantha]
MANTSNHISAATPSSSYNNQNQSYTQQPISQYPHQSASPIPNHYSQYASHSTSNFSQNQPNPTNMSFQSAHIDHYATPQGKFSHPQPSYRSNALPGSTANSVRPYEVYRLSEQANAQIPSEIRQQFQQDEQGNVLFFTAPPLDVLRPDGEGSAVGHTVKYLAEKLRRKIALEEKRKAEGLPEGDTEPFVKKAKSILDAYPPTGQIHEMRDRALSVWADQMREGATQIYKDIYGSDWKKAERAASERLAMSRERHRRKRAALQASRRRREERDNVSLTRSEVFLDDVDPRY